MAAISKRLLVIAFCSLCLVLSQAPQASSATTYFEDFEGAGWPAANQQQCATQTIGSFIYGWYVACNNNCCTTLPGSYWALSTEQAHSGTHSMKQKFPRNAPELASMTRIYWPGGPEFTEFSCGGWFYIPSNWTLNDNLKWLNLRFANGSSRQFIVNPGAPSGICAQMSLDGGTSFVYPQGSPTQLKYYALYLCNPDGSKRYLARGQWHHVKIYMKLVPAPEYTDIFTLWIDGEIAKVRWGATGAESALPGGHVVDANLTDIELGGDALTHMTWNLNANAGVFQDADYYLYWDDIFISNDFTPPHSPTAVSVP